jgi:hypothetical protein
MKVTLKLEIDYNTDEFHTESGEELNPDEHSQAARDAAKAVLAGSVARLVGEGGLSGETSLTVESWHVSYADGSEIDIPAPRRRAVPRLRTRKSGSKS